MPVRCGGGCGRQVRGIYCAQCKADRHARQEEARRIADAAARARLSDPEVQARMRAARAARKESDQ